ncbi:MAG: SIS domain-containing protein [Candidatus Omnitrophota bacterium]
MDFIKEYTERLKEAISALELEEIKRIAKLLISEKDKDRTIFFCGNGGSAACASHTTNDIAKLTIVPGQKRFRAICLSDNIPLLTAWANDNGYEHCFVEPLKNLYQNGDVLIAISGSGNSKNVLNAVEYVNANGGVTIGLTGLTGGRLATLTQNTIQVKSDSMQIIEDVHVFIGHIICSYIAHLSKGK